MSSTSKDQHDYALGKGGLVKHTKLVVFFANFLSEVNPFNLTRFELDCAIGALLLCDTRLLGFDDNTKGEYTRFDHPLLAARAILDAYDIGVRDMSTFAIYTFKPDIDKDILKSVLYIASAVASHMGQWNTNEYVQNVTLPLPKTNLQKFVHICNHLASCKRFF